MKKTRPPRTWLFTLMTRSALQVFLALLTTGLGLARPTAAQDLLDRRITLRLEAASLRVALTEIGQEADVKFTYNSRLLPTDRRISVEVRDERLETVLDRLLRPLGIGYTVVSRQIILKALSTPPQSGFLEPQPEEVPDVTVSGRVTDQAGAGLPAVNVAVKGTTRGTTTDGDGRYRLAVPDASSVLVFSSVGYEKVEVVVGTQTTVDVTLKADVQSLNEVVVTAFGVQREQKALGYATQTIEGKRLSAVSNTNLGNALQGKAAGVTVRLTSGMPGRAPQVTIRGARSMTGSNQPLYVIDGLPVAGGDRAVDFNPSDIESINILKGPAASALYGLRASNGVIVITTKSGKAGQTRPTVSFDTQVSADRAAFLPDIQQMYSQGANDRFDQTGLFSWGAKIADIGTYTNLLGEQEQAAAYRHDKAFYKTGTTLVSGLDVSQGGTLGSYSLGVSQTRQTGIIPNSGLRRTNFKINGLFTPYERFKIGLSLNYSDLKVNDYPDETGNAIYFRGLTDAPPSYNMAGKPYASPTDPYQQIYFRAGQNNPYWIINNNHRTTKTGRTFGNVFAEYRLADGLKVNYRIGLDQFTTRLLNYAELGTGPIGRTVPPSGGALALVNTTQSQVNSNAFLTFDKTFGQNWTLNAIAGNELYDIRTTVDRSDGGNFVAGNWASLSNATTVTASNVLSRQRVVGFYGNLNLGWKERIFLTASGRNDYVSNMPAAQRSFFYPSVGLSAVLTELVPALGNGVVDFAKFRANFAEVGQAGPLYVNGVGYVQRNPSGQGTGAFLFPFNGITAFTPSLTAINPDIRPENTKSLEAGFEVKLLKNRISLDYTYFRSRSDGQILSVPLPISTGASSEVRNAGKLSSFGHEVVLTLVPLKTTRVEWDFTTNFTFYRTYVDELPEGLTRITLSDANAGLLLNVAQKGERYPSLFGRSFARDPATGQLVMNAVSGQPTTGMPLLDNVARIIGTPTPDFEVNFINTLRLGPASLSVQVDWRQGGKFWSISQAEARWRGLAGETLTRDEQVTLPGKKGRFVNGQLVVEGDNDIPIFRKVDYYNSLFNNAEANLNDASFVRLRELNLSVDLPTGFLKKSLGLSSASLFLTGRNLFLITRAFTDPELNMTNLPGSSAENSAGVEFSQQPQTRSFGAGVRLRW